LRVNKTTAGIHRGCALGITALLVIAGCARPAPPPAETPARVKDSAPDKIAAQRAALPGLDLEPEDQRWGIEAARERRNAARPETPGTTPPAAGAPRPQPPEVQKPQPTAAPTTP
jgi:hypothetical protein